MTVPITGSVKDVTGVEDNDTPWSFASVIRFAEDGSVITEKPREVRAVSGNLKVNLVPGYAIVTYGKQVWQVTVPETATTLKALIEAGVAFPPDTSQALLDAAVGQYVETHREQFRTRAVPITTGPDAGKVQWYDENGLEVGGPVTWDQVIPTEVAQAAVEAEAPAAVGQAAADMNPVPVPGPTPGKIAISFNGTTGGEFNPLLVSWTEVVGRPNLFVAVDGSDTSSVNGSEFIENTVRPWYGKSKNVGNVGNSFGWAGSPDTTPATTITADVTFPLTNSTIAVADTAQLNANGGSFTLGGKRVAYLGRSTASGAGNAIGCYSEPTDTGTVTSGTALGNTPTGFFGLTVYQRFGFDGRPNVGATQGFGVVTSYRSPTVDDSAESGSFAVTMADSGSPQVQHRTVTGGEMTASLLGNWHLPDGHTGALNGGGMRTHVAANNHAKNVIGLKVNPTVEAGGFVDNYDAVYQTNSALQIYGTLNGAATFPQATVPVTGTFPPATTEHPVTVRVGSNGQGMGGTQITYTGQSGGSLTGCTGGTGTHASGTNVANFAYGVNVKDPILSNAGFLAAASTFSGSFALALQGIQDSSNSMMQLVLPSTADVPGGCTGIRIIGGSGSGKSQQEWWASGGATAASRIIANGTFQSRVGIGFADATYSAYQILMDSSGLTITDKNVVLSTATGTKFGTATTQKLGFWNATPAVQPAAVADATDASTVITQLNALLSRLRTIGLIAT